MKMNDSETLSEIKAELVNSPDLLIRSPLSLYFIAEARPKPGVPDWVEVGCMSKEGVEGVVAYLSPLDALIDAKSRNRQGRLFHVHPLEALDPRHFVATHNQWLTVSLVYGFAARNKQFVVDADGDLQALTINAHFNNLPKPCGHFHLGFSDKVSDWIDTVHRTAKFYDYPGMVSDLAGYTLRELEHEADQAMLRAGLPGSSKLRSVTHYAVYDHIERCWRFTAFAAMEQ